MIRDATLNSLYAEFFLLNKMNNDLFRIKGKKCSSWLSVVSNDYKAPFLLSTPLFVVTIFIGSGAEDKFHKRQFLVDSQGMRAHEGQAYFVSDACMG